VKLGYQWYIRDRLTNSTTNEFSQERERDITYTLNIIGIGDSIFRKTLRRTSIILSEGNIVLHNFEVEYFEIF
jgi:hypothetical protein